MASLGVLLAALGWGVPAAAQLVANSLAELRSYGLSVNNSTITLSATGGDPHPVTGVVTPGQYWINGNHIANPTNSMPTFMELSGTGNTYNLSGATINLDTRKLDGFGRALGHDSGIEVVKISGTGNTVNGLNLTGYDLALDTAPNAQRYADWAAVYVQMTGDNNSVNGANVLTRGSYPYGYGDVFGKGARVDPQGSPADEGGLPWIAHRKTSAFQVIDATNAVIDDMHLEVKAYGHGFFVQGTSTNTTLTNSTVTGELFSSNDVINLPLYQEYGFTSHGNELPPDIMISGAEDGVRMYTGPVGLTVDNVVVTNMRTGFSTALGKGTMTLNNVEAYGTENAFNLTSNTTITNAKGDIANGPLIYIPYDNVSNSTVDIELVGDVPQGVDWAVAYLNGNNLDVAISSDLPAGALPADSMVRLGQKFYNNWRDSNHPTGPDDGAADYINSEFHNNTNQLLVLGEDVTGNTGSSNGGVITNGKNNYYDGISLVPTGKRTVLVHTAGLGNNGTAANGSLSLETNASVVQGGGTLELSPGIQVNNEKLTITGDGVDGKGALYSDGQAGSGTRFGSSSNSNESTIFLDGDASIGVGVAGNQVLVGRIQGAGDLTKRGPGKLSIEKSSTFLGDLIVAEGEVAARSGVAVAGLRVMSGARFTQIQSNAVNTSQGVLIDGVLDLTNTAGTGVFSGAVGALSGTGIVEASSTTALGPHPLTINPQSGSADFSGAIRTNINLAKTGAGTQVLTGLNTYTGATTVNAGVLLVNGAHTGGGAYTVNSGGTLGGDGAIAASVVVKSGGRLAPGASSGSLQIASLNLESGSTLEIELGGVQSDLLTGGNIALGGNLAVSLIDSNGQGFVPYASDLFTVVSATALSGAFANVASGGRIETLGGEGSFLAAYDASLDAVQLSGFVPSGLSGDYNEDGVVDAADYTRWRDALGQTGLVPWSGADGTGDGQITADDYAVWKNNFGAVASAPVAAASVPEPGACLMLIAVVAAWGTGVRRRETFRVVARGG
ncbi:Autotransporter-associated beta strand repeat protein [Pirellulimonas nuda]|uniref:Autotransporter-associated beta strand repeat protein n=1 Tax=Pirellulimonas nuda TaxID=2528009 RepID=A0A518DBM3_9BACT|nr:autotransporter-associated beta strand repeat-containing protein [Pirellulimonas nuda]QDU88872.1 Autotransporter-associated beta strand repeat protein [Pirellulimonas nuda]